MKNRRPITLLNCDYKSASKWTATTIKKVLLHWISNYQTAFHKVGLSEEIPDWLTAWLTTLTNRTSQICYFLLTSKKASILWNGLLMRKRSPTTTSKSLLNDITSCIQNLCWSSDFFQLGGGVGQGSPLSLYLFILCVEALGNAIWNDDVIKGFCISNSECKMSQYADYATLILNGTDNSKKHLPSFLDFLAEFAGLKVNYKKKKKNWSALDLLTSPSKKYNRN